jgi:hypothetical protein
MVNMESACDNQVPTAGASFKAAPADQSSTVDRWMGRWMGVICAFAIGLAPLGAVHAKKPPFEIRSAESRLYEGVWLANALIDFRLSEEALAALDNGVALTIELQFRLDRVRKFWFDKEKATLKKRIELSYQPLSERYVVQNLNSGEHESFATLVSALISMGRIVDLPIIDASLLKANRQYQISLRAVLDQNTLPGPLRMFAFWGSGFRLESDWYVWMLNA